MTAAHLYLNVRREDGEWRVTCACGEVVRHESRAIAMAAWTEHALAAYERRAARPVEWAS